MNKIASIRIGLRDRFERFYTEDLVRLSRKRRAKQIFPLKAPYALELTSAQREEISAYWKPYRNIDKEMHWFAFYNAFCDDKSQLKHYIPDGVYFTDMDFPFTNPRRSDDLDDKNMYDLYFHDVPMPETVIRIMDGVILDKDYQLITIDQALALCQEAQRVVCKEARLSMGGYGVSFVDLASTSPEDFRQWLEKNKNRYINVQRVIEQHDSISRIHPSSINTIRVMSLVFEGEVHILSSIIRMGQGGAVVDNASKGGMMTGVSSDGWLKEYAFDQYGKRWSQHPQGTVFKGTQIVGVDRCHDVVRRLAGRMCTTTKLMSWDFAIDPAGEPILIEVNLTYSGVVIHQLCNGPIFGDMTDRMLSYIYHNKR